jgi:hypothetical protein
MFSVGYDAPVTWKRAKDHLPMFCSNCGTQLPDEAKFCSNCGKPTHSTASGSGSSIQTEREDVPIVDQQEGRTTQPITGPGIAVEPGSLEEAVREAQAGDVLRLKAGEHRLSRPLVIKKPLSLIGEGMDNTRVVCDGEECVVQLQQEGPFVLHDLSIEHEGSRRADVVQVAGGEIDIRRCRFRGGVWDRALDRYGVGLSLRGQTRA